jgi:hypothetical protein
MLEIFSLPIAVLLLWTYFAFAKNGERYVCRQLKLTTRGFSTIEIILGNHGGIETRVLK